MWRELLRLPEEPSSVLEVLILFVLLWGLLTLLRGTRGEGMLKTLGLLLAVAFLVLRSVAVGQDLDRLALVLDAIFQASVIALVVIFQPELRRGLAVKVGQRWLTSTVPERRVVDEVVSACDRLSKGRVGALIAFEGKDSLRSYLATGTVVDAEVKADLLMNVFYPGSPLHDGAVVLQDGRLAAAGCFLPLTDSPDVPKSLGTRHRAAIGLSETEDSIVVVVSEETGNISVAEAGSLHRDLDRDELHAMLRELYLQPRHLEEDSEDSDGGDMASSAPSPPPAAPGKSTTRVKRRIVAS